MSTKTLSNLVSIPLLAGCLLAAGCSMESDEPARTDDRLLRLGSGQQPGSTIDRIASGFHVVSADELGLVADDQMEAQLDGVRGVAMSLADASDSDLEEWMPILQAARKGGIPLIIEDVDDSERLASVLGIGIEADLVMMTPMGNSYRIDVYGDNSVLEEHFAEDGIPGTLSPTPQEDLDLAVQEVSEGLLAHVPGRVFKTVNYYYYDINFSTYSWAVGNSQTATLNLDFEAQLIADQLKNKKFVTFSQSGGGHHPGTLYTDGQYDRGWFQEAALVKITPTTNGSNVDLYAHAPATSNNSSSYASTTGWGAQASVDSEGKAGLTLSYSSSSTVTTVLTDFTAVNNTSGKVANWNFKLFSVGGHSYNNWDDIFYQNAFQRCKLYSLPNLAKSNLTPQFEAIYRANGNYTGTTTFQLETKSLLRDTSATGTIFKCNMNSTWSMMTRTKNVSINFNQVAM